MNRRRRVVLLGGTFDPVHTGHLALISGALDALGAPEGVLLVDPGHRHRGVPSASLADRRRLVRRATAHDPRVHEAGEIGLDGGLEEAVQHLGSEGREVHVVFGADSARHLDRWDAHRRLAGARLWVVPRSGELGQDLVGVEVLPLEVPSVSSTQIRFALADGRRPPLTVPAACRDAVTRLYSPVPSYHAVAEHA